jgi:hypothetical protein
MRAVIKALTTGMRDMLKVFSSRISSFAEPWTN